MGIAKQSKSVTWLGALQTQIQNSMFYVNFISMGMMVLTFWYTAGYQIRDNILNWFSLWNFVVAVAILFLIVMVLDYKYVLPSRQSFANEQACKHSNPAMDKLIEIEANQKKIMHKLGL